ncbi:MAG: YdcF family protein [Crocinitomicaceae bacterium]|nr:YdcF family protein [Crocinitomicaceae bacterium]
MGGMLSFNDSNDHLVFNSNSNRLTSAIELYKKGVIKRIIISGGSGSVAYPLKREASLLKKFMVNYLSIPDSVIFIENKSDNTHQNAVFTKKLLEQMKIVQQDLILITSPLHKVRAFLCFKKEGVNVVNYEFKVDQKQKKWLPTQSIVPSEEILINWVAFLHELVGLLVYKMVGYI